MALVHLFNWIQAEKQQETEGDARYQAVFSKLVLIMLRLPETAWFCCFLLLNNTSIICIIIIIILSRSSDNLFTVQPFTSPHTFMLCNGSRPFSDMPRQHLFPMSDSGKHSITCAMFQQPWLVRKYKVYHILDAKSLVSTPAWGDPEDKCSFPEWFIMLRLHYLAFWVWHNEARPSAS